MLAVDQIKSNEASAIELRVGDLVKYKGRRWYISATEKGEKFVRLYFVNPSFETMNIWAHKFQTFERAR